MAIVRSGVAGSHGGRSVDVTRDTTRHTDRGTAQIGDLSEAVPGPQLAVGPAGGSIVFTGQLPVTSGATSTTNLWVTQTGVETYVAGGGGDLRVSQLGIEAFFSIIPALVVTQTGVEVFIDHSAGYVGGSKAFTVVMG